MSISYTCTGRGRWVFLIIAGVVQLDLPLLSNSPGAVCDSGQSLNRLDRHDHREALKELRKAYLTLLSSTGPFDLRCPRHQFFLFPSVCVSSQRHPGLHRLHPRPLPPFAPTRSTTTHPVTSIVSWAIDRGAYMSPPGCLDSALFRLMAAQHQPAPPQYSFHGLRTRPLRWRRRS